MGIIPNLAQNYVKFCSSIIAEYVAVLWNRKIFIGCPSVMGFEGVPGR